MLKEYPTKFYLTILEGHYIFTTKLHLKLVRKYAMLLIQLSDLVAPLVLILSISKAKFSSRNLKHLYSC